MAGTGHVGSALLLGPVPVHVSRSSLLRALGSAVAGWGPIIVVVAEGSNALAGVVRSGPL